jgi:hypothetical protein
MLGRHKSGAQNRQTDKVRFAEKVPTRSALNKNEWSGQRRTCFQQARRQTISELYKPCRG